MCGEQCTLITVSDGQWGTTSNLSAWTLSKQAIAFDLFVLMVRASVLSTDRDGDIH